MRLLLTLFALAALLHAPARADPRAAPGWRVGPLPYALVSPPGAARDGTDLVLTEIREIDVRIGQTGPCP